jgi:hypothetical protein
MPAPRSPTTVFASWAKCDGLRRGFRRYDGLRIAVHFWPALTSFRADPHEQGRTGVPWRRVGTEDAEFIDLR